MKEDQRQDTFGNTVGGAALCGCIGVALVILSMGGCERLLSECDSVRMEAQAKLVQATRQLSLTNVTNMTNRIGDNAELTKTIHDALEKIDKPTSEH